MPSDNQNSELTERLPLLIMVAVVFMRPLVSGLGMEVWGPRQFAHLSMQAAPLALLAYAALSSRQKPVLPAAWGVILMLAASLGAAVSGLNHFVSFERFCDLAGGLGLMICVATWSRGERERRELIGVMLFSAAIVSLYGIYQYYWGFEKTIDYLTREAPNLTNADHYRQVFGKKRIFSTTFSPDMLAGFLATILPLALGMMAESRALTDRLFPATVVVIAVVALYMTGSLGGWLAAGVGTGVWYFILFVDRRKRLIAAAIIGGVILVFTAGILARRSETLLDLKHPENPITQRLFFWEGGLKVACHHPLLGVGPGNFGIAYLGRKSEGAEMTRYAHSHWINVLAETGPVGLAGWIIIAASFLIGAWKKVRVPPLASQAVTQGNDGLNRLEAGILAAGVAFLAHGLIDFDLEVPEIAGYFWVIAGLSAVGIKELKTKGLNPLSGERIVFCLIALSLCVLNLLRVPGDAYLQNGRDAAKTNQAMACWFLGRSIEWRPGDIVPFEERAKLWPDNEEGRQLAIQDMRKAAALSPLDPFVWLSTGEFLFNIAEYDGALNAFREAGRLFPTWKIATGWEHLAYAKVLIEKKKYPEARAELNAILKEFPGHPAAVDGMEEIEELEKDQKK